MKRIARCRGTWFFVTLLALISACSPSNHSGVSVKEQSGAGQVTDDSSPADNRNGPSGNGSPHDPNAPREYSKVCHSQQFAISMEPVRVIILLDQSSSMTEGVVWGQPGGAQDTHWSEATKGLEHLLSDSRNRDLYFALDPFPDGTVEYFQKCHDPCCSNPFCMSQPANLLRCINLSTQCNRSCAVDLPPVVALDRAVVSGPAIIEYMNFDFLPGDYTQTPLVKQLQYYQEDRTREMPEFYSRDGSSYLVVVSDGDDTCEAMSEDGDVSMIVEDIGSIVRNLLEQHGIKSFAIGFGDTTGTMADELNAIAANGGTPFDTFFAVNEAGSLQEAFDKISSTIATCVYDIDEPDATADPNKINFYFDGAVIGQDENCQQGWRWTAESTPEHPQVEFCGDACDSIMEGRVANIEARFGCETILI